MYIQFKNPQIYVKLAGNQPTFIIIIDKVSNNCLLLQTFERCRGFTKFTRVWYTKFIRSNMKSVILISFLSLITITMQGNNFIRNKSYRCFGSNKTVLNYNCFAKSYSRTHQTLNLAVNLTRKITSWMVILKATRVWHKKFIVYF